MHRLIKLTLKSKIAAERVHYLMKPIDKIEIPRMRNSLYMFPL